MNFVPFVVESKTDHHRGHEEHEGKEALDSHPEQIYFADMKAISELAKDALKLPPAQRLTLARILLDLTGEGGDFSPEIEAAWETEICRRREEVKSGCARSGGFDQVFARLDQRFPA